MSAKITIKYHNSNDENDYHLYMEIFDEDVYLELARPEFEFRNNKLAVKIPKFVFEEIGRQELVNKVKDNSDSFDVNDDEWFESLNRLKDKG